MRRLLACSFLFAAISAAGAAHAARPLLTTTTEGKDLRIVVHGVTDYCSTDADTRIMRTSETIRIIRERPSRVSRCLAKTDMEFVVKDVEPGMYRVTYEQIPLVAPARALTIASTTAVVREPPAP
jgi:hypothetical protein